MCKRCVLPELLSFGHLGDERERIRHLDRLHLLEIERLILVSFPAGRADVIDPEATAQDRDPAVLLLEPALGAAGQHAAERNTDFMGMQVGRDGGRRENRTRSRISAGPRFSKPARYRSGSLPDGARSRDRTGQSWLCRPAAPPWSSPCDGDVGWSRTTGEVKASTGLQPAPCPLQDYHAKLVPMAGVEPARAKLTGF